MKPPRRKEWWAVLARQISVTAAAVALVALTGMGGTTVAPRIAALELQPEDPSPGGSFVVVTNPGTAAVELGCWRVASSTGMLVVAPPLRLAPGATALLSARTSWLRQTDRVRLLDTKLRVRSATPTLSDPAADDRIWFRDADGAWRLGRKGFGKGVIAGHLVKRASSRC
jgi:hypothetical protein